MRYFKTRRVTSIFEVDRVTNIWQMSVHIRVRWELPPHTHVRIFLHSDLKLKLIRKTFCFYFIHRILIYISYSISHSQNPKNIQLAFTFYDFFIRSGELDTWRHWLILSLSLTLFENEHSMDLKWFQNKQSQSDASSEFELFLIWDFLAYLHFEYGLINFNHKFDNKTCILNLNFYFLGFEKSKSCMPIRVNRTCSVYIHTNMYVHSKSVQCNNNKKMQAKLKHTHM